MARIDAAKIDAALGQLRKLCAGLPGAEEYVMVHHPAFRVGKKPFLIAGMNEHDAGATLSVNLGRDAQDALLEDARFTRTPYIGQHGWVTVAHAKVGAKELAELVRDSWRRVATRKHLASLEGSPSAPTKKAAAKSASRARR
ncbi:MAG TPA: MmcQ/YjbR family DNA-binding protein [Polyangiales bacterium]|nr:MmcQ/YjbR family DNA-binding protein [Polyangiales bacterium]